MLQRFGPLVLLTALALALLLQIPQLIHQFDPRAQGVLVQLNSDEDIYLARVEEALSGRPEQTAEAFVGDPTLKGSQPAFLETLIGRVFSWTGWRAATVLQIMDSVTGFLFFLFLFLFLRECGFKKVYAYTGSLLFVLVELAALNRPIHQGASFLLVLMTLFALVQGARGNILLGVAGGIILGILVGTHFWSWSYAWLWVALLLVFECLSQQREKRWQRLVLLAVIGVLVAAPFVEELIALMQHSLWDFAVFRSGMHPSRSPESWPYSILFTIMVLGVFSAFRKKPELWEHHALAAVTLLTAFGMMHQQMIHGITFNFVSHYLFGLLLGAICVLLLAWTVRTRALMIAGAASLIYIGALAYDGRWVVQQFVPQENAFEEQHFAPLLPVLDGMPRTRILSDPAASSFIAGSTHHDIVYSIYLKNVLMSHKEIAERYCLTQLPLAPEERRIAEQKWLIYPDAVSAFKDNPSVREEEVNMVEEACARADRDPKTFLRAYGVSTVLWDEKHQPTWDLKRLKVKLEKTAASVGWSLWRLRTN